MQAPPPSGVPMPHDIESGFRKIFLHVIETGECRIEFFAGIVGKARAITRDEAVFASPPLAENIDRVIERSEEHTSELQSLMRISYAVFCLKKKNNKSMIQSEEIHEY